MPGRLMCQMQEDSSWSGLQTNAINDENKIKQFINYSELLKVLKSNIDNNKF